MDVVYGPVEAGRWDRAGVEKGWSTDRVYGVTRGWDPLAGAFQLRRRESDDRCQVGPAGQ